MKPRFKPEWNTIGNFEQPLAQALVLEVTELLYAADPSASVLDETAICVILGSRNCGYKAQRASDLFGERPEVKFIACGANISVAGIPEAELIHDVLFENGISKEQIIIEGHSRNTLENLEHAEHLVQELLVNSNSNSITIVSSGFHHNHVMASLPASLRHANFVSATGPYAGRDNWHTNPIGRAAILHELNRLKKD